MVLLRSGERQEVRPGWRKQVTGGVSLGTISGPGPIMLRALLCFLSAVM